MLGSTPRESTSVFCQRSGQSFLRIALAESGEGSEAITELRLENCTNRTQTASESRKMGLWVGFGSLDSIPPMKHQHPVFPRSGRRDLEHDRFERNVRFERFEYSDG
jgi:hypothetical protein